MQVFADMARGQLLALAAGEIQVSNGLRFPLATRGAAADSDGVSWFKLVLSRGNDYEICYVMTHAGDGVFRNVLRAQDGTTVQDWPLQETAAMLAPVASDHAAFARQDGGAQTGDVLLTIRDPGPGYVRAGEVYLQASYTKLFELVGLLESGDPNVSGKTAWPNNAWAYRFVYRPGVQRVLALNINAANSYTSQLSPTLPPINWVPNTSGIPTNVPPLVLMWDATRWTTIPRNTSAVTVTGSHWTCPAGGTTVTSAGSVAVNPNRAFIPGAACTFGTTGWVFGNVGSTSCIVKTTNSGASFTEILYSFPISNGYTHALAFSAQIVMGCSEGAVWLRSVDGGASFNNVGVYGRMQSAVVFNGTDGAYAATGGIALTFDAGATWQLKDATAANDICRLSSGVLLAVGPNATLIVCRTPGGESWKAYPTGVGGDFVAVLPLTESTALVSCTDGNRYIADVGLYNYDHDTQFLAPRVMLAAGSDVQAYIKA